ncbi:AAA family ATPase [Sodalinema gerasimenkoae]|uniref:AAA family ATPase n=1 Tax=Sodalinema gerasimenkoae TaxID=2862348 RepID=UPI00248430C7|nr:ATP-binding protein [Sodalinema gerasimenkoae]
MKPTDIVDPQDWHGCELIPQDFQSLIEEKLKRFCGRKFVFKAFGDFIKKHPCGYFIVIGEAGIGKSAVAAKYVQDHHVPGYFNILAERRNRAELFLKSLRGQLQQRYNLPNSDNADLRELLANVARQLPEGEPLVVVVDALDEVEQEAGENLLHLPKELPDNVYFLLTRRPYSLETKRLTVSAGTATDELDLSGDEYAPHCRRDVEEYLGRWWDEETALQQWTQGRHLSRKEFVETLADKSENNFMYLRYVLPEMVNGNYDSLELTQLPQGLQEYYQTHWVRMGMERAERRMRVMVLFVLVEIGAAVPAQVLADVLDEDILHVQKVLNKEWREYLKLQPEDGEDCYSIYHASFLDFLNGKVELKPTRKLFCEVNQRIADYQEREMEQ